MRTWAVIPAAGSGSRMAADTPKQYLTLLGRPVLAHTLARIAALPGLEAVVVALAPEDRHWSALAADRPTGALALHHCPGGADRYQSVINALAALEGRAGDADLVLVHDAVRPCVQPADMQHLLEAARASEWGALLATPVTDTLKEADARQRVRATRPREGLWSALTPQVFPFALLRQSLERARAAGEAVTDESAAIERAGGHPRLVAGRRDNLKITWPEDLAQAARIQRAQADQGFLE